MHAAVHKKGVRDAVNNQTVYDFEDYEGVIPIDLLIINKISKRLCKLKLKISDCSSASG